MFSEYFTDQTVGKRLFGLRVVQGIRRSHRPGPGLRPSAPQFLQVFWIDIMFALFTDRSQRAFELLSHTRVVQIASGEELHGAALDAGGHMTAVGQ